MYLEGSRRLNEGKTTYYRKHGVDMVLVCGGDIPV
jgi:hypothetical protein